MSMIKLRDYQNECIGSIKDKFEEGKKTQLVSLPTGSGKTVIFGSLIKEMGMKSIVLTHTEDLLNQTESKMRLFNKGKTIEKLSGKHKNFDADILVSTVQSACTDKTLEKLVSSGYELMIIDECHHSAAETWRKTIEAISPKLLVGMTATPFRSDEKGLAEIYDIISYTKSIGYMIDNKYLCNIQSKQIRSDIDTSTETNEPKSDFSSDYLEKTMNCPELIEDTVKKFIEEAPNRKTIAFCTSIDHSDKLSKKFNESGISSRSIHGGLKSDIREQIIEDFKLNRFQVLTNCQILTEGFDEPSVDCVIIAKPTRSKALFQQMIGRGLRLYPNKSNCLILDFTDLDRTIYSVSKLMHDREKELSDDEKINEFSSKDEDKNDYEDELPISLNKKLKTILVEINLFKNEFHWQQTGLGHILTGTKFDLEIVETSKDLYKIVKRNENDTIEIMAQDLDFDMCFGICNDCARDNMSNFILTDRNANWRNDSISDKQLAFLKKKRYKGGIEELTKGQASDIMGYLLNR